MKPGAEPAGILFLGRFRQNLLGGHHAWMILLPVSLSQRGRLLAEYAEGPMPPDDRVDPQEMPSILEEAVGARNGWKRILKACSNQRRRKAHSVKAETPV